LGVPFVVCGLWDRYKRREKCLLISHAIEPHHHYPYPPIGIEKIHSLLAVTKLTHQRHREEKEPEGRKGRRKGFFYS
jgi:hypothetical protein